MIPAEKYFGVSVSALRDTTTALEHRAPLSCEAGSWKIFLGYASYGYEQGVRNGFAPKFPTLKIPFKKFFEAARVCEVFAQKKFFLFAAKFAARDFAGSPEVCPPKFADTTSWRGGMTSKPACLLAEFPDTTARLAHLTSGFPNMTSWLADLSARFPDKTSFHKNTKFRSKINF